MSAHRDVAAVTPERVYFLPHPALRKIISHYTVFLPDRPGRRAREPERLHIVPDARGCIVCPLTRTPSAPRLWGPTPPGAPLAHRRLLCAGRSAAG